MAKSVKKSFGKSSLRLSSIFLAVFMVVLTLFIGTAPTVAQAETLGTGNVIKVTDYKGVFCGQNVVLEAGKTYAFSYYYSGTEVIPGWIYDGDDTGVTSYEPTNIVYDYEYDKVTYEFVVPNTATPAEEEGKVKIYLGIRIPTADTYYFYHPTVYAVDDETKTNLFFDYLFTGKNTLEGAETGAGNWHKPYAGASGKLGWKFSKPSLESLGGLDFFRKPVNVIKVTDYINVLCGQSVELEAGKAYSYSYYYDGPSVVPGIIYDANNSAIEPTKKVYDNEYNKITYEFVAPAGEGNVTVYLGIKIPTAVDTYYYYYPCVYALDDETKTNLFFDYLFTGKNTLEGAETGAGNWHKPYAGASGKLGWKFSKPNLDSVGGMDLFKKTDADRYVIKLEAGKSSNDTYFGQHVELEAGKTYFVSTCYTGDNFGHAVRKTGTYTTLPNIGSSYDNDAFRKTTAFTVPIDEGETEGIKKSMWVGVACYSVSSPIYLYDFKLYDPENPEVNLYKDTELLESGTGIDSVWCHPSKPLVSGCFTKVRPSEAGGTEVFYKTDADRKVLKLEANTSGQPYFGQFISLEAGKTYVFSNYYLPGAEAIQKICYSGTNEIETEIISDKDYSKQGVKFTVPADAPDDGTGKKNIWVGFRGQKLDYPIYYYDLKLYDVELPQINLLADSNLYSGGGLVHYNTWKTPSKTATSSAYSLITLEDIGGIEYFMAFSKKCDVTLDEKIDIRDLVRLKRFSVGSVETLPENRGDLNGDFTAGNATDLILLKKEIIK